MSAPLILLSRFVSSIPIPFSSSGLRPDLAPFARWLLQYNCHYRKMNFALLVFCADEMT